MASPINIFCNKSNIVDNKEVIETLGISFSNFRTVDLTYQTSYLPPQYYQYYYESSPKTIQIKGPEINPGDESSVFIGIIDRSNLNVKLWYDIKFKPPECRILSDIGDDILELVIDEAFKEQIKMNLL